ncbi:MAG: winged helix-turn-helix transcriptional regulator [Saprospiraceae bacterium]|nr:winged helix-turn-helix transcriptional regulator [Saprospiraceae bacterium]MCB0624984.1 winged helix-turn-helix transcriptional regulator [Saprospiraceae bacterium]MCB0676209.1 winged helix-turn-helix transcriptional regulator [Saprospiraceae bacterium]MCB0682963.1 winged helix-turn-helix transcriptional regulator [Saprospiraceae bacterium]
MERSPSAPFDSLVFLTNRVGRLLANRIGERFAAGEHGLSMPHIGILADLWVQDGVRQQDLAVSVIKDKATIARALDTMERCGVVVRRADLHDKRNKRIFLTDKGRQIREELLPVADEVITEATAGIPAASVAVCKEVLMHLYKNLFLQSTQPDQTRSSSIIRPPKPGQ